MAYGVRYRAEWRATTRGERYYVLDILKNNYTGSISPMYLTGECVTITYGEVDESELQPIKSSEAEIYVLCTEAGNPYMELFTLDPAQYQVQITENGEQIWQGYLATGDYQQPLSRPPYTVRFRANDGLGVLKAMPYLDSEGNRFVGVESISALIRKLLLPISDSVDIWGYNQLYYGQTSSTFDIAGIPNESIYRVFSNDEPTYYDVLEAILKNFGVQLFQQDAKWCVRSIGMLATAVNSELLTPVALDDDSTAGLGIKADAALSFLPPLRKLIAPERTESNSVDLTDIVCNPGNWVASTGYMPYMPAISRYGKAVKIRSLGYSERDTIIMGCSTLVLAPIIQRSQSIRLSFTAEMRSNDVSADTNVYIGVWLVDAGGGRVSNVVSWGAEGYANSRVSFPQRTRYWDDEGKVWKSLATIDNPSYSALGLKKVTIPKATASGLRPALSVMAVSNVSFEFPNMPTNLASGGYNEKYQLAIIVASAGGRSVTTYLDKPTMTIEATDGMVQTSNSKISISNDGITDENYDAKWRSATETALSVDAFAPSLVNVLDTEKQIYGYIEATSGVADKDVVGKMLNDLRGRTTKVIEGEVDKSVGYGLNDIFTYNSRYYYANQVKKLLKRGISSVQLRELPQLAEKNGTIHLGFNLPKDKNLVGLSNTFYYLTSNKLYRYDMVSEKVTSIRSVNADAKLSRGVDCVVVTEINSDTSLIAEAYDKNGTSIAKLTADNWMLSPRYDAVAEVWLTHDSFGRVAMCDKEGYVICRWELPLAIENYVSIDTDIKLYNGGFVMCVTAHTSAAVASYYAYWHCYAIHAAGMYEDVDNFTFGHKNIRFVNERFVVCQENRNLIVYHRDSIDMGASSPMSTYILPTNSEFIAANNALIVIRAEVYGGGYSISVYDARNTAKTKVYSLNVGSSASGVALCDDIVVAKGDSIISSMYSWVRVLPLILSVKY